MTELARPRSLHRRHRLPRGRQDDADPPPARERRRPAAGDHRQRVRRRRHRRRDPEGLRHRELPGGEHRRAGQRLHLLHGRRRLRAGARPDPAPEPAGRPHPDRDLRASRCRSRWCRRSSGRRCKSRVTVDGVIAVVDGPALAEGRVAADLDALAAQRAADASLDHDDPVEEVFEDQVACADLIVLSKTDLLDAAGAGGGAGADRRASGARGEDRADRAGPGRSGGAARARARGRGRHRRAARRITTTSSTTSTTTSTASSSSCRRWRDPEDLAARVAAAAEAADVLRVKGFAEVAGKPMRLLVQAVGPRVVAPLRPRLGARARRAGTRLVVIGLKGLDRGAVERILRLA